MIHSLAGGMIGKEEYFDFALVEILEAPHLKEKYWYISKPGLKLGDTVLVCVKGKEIKAVILRIDKNISSYNSPIPLRVSKHIIKRV